MGEDRALRVGRRLRSPRVWSAHPHPPLWSGGVSRHSHARKGARIRRQCFWASELETDSGERWEGKTEVHFYVRLLCPEGIEESNHAMEPEILAQRRSCHAGCGSAD